MPENRYVAAWRELKEWANYGEIDHTLTKIEELEIKHGIPNKEVQNASCKPKE